MAGGGGEDSSAEWDFGLLQERLSAARASEVERDRARARNWKTGRMNQQIVFVMEGDFVRQMRFVDDCMVVGSCRGKLFVVDMNTQAVLATIRGLTKHVTALAFDGSLIAAGSVDTNILIASRTEGKRHILSGHTDTVTSIIIVGPGRAGYEQTTAVSGSLDGTIKIWDVMEGRQLASYDVEDPILCLCRSDNYLLVGCKSGMVHVYAMTRGNKILDFTCHSNGNVTAIGFNSKSQTFLAAGAGGDLKVFCFKTGKEQQCIKGHQDAIVDCQFDDSKIVSASRDGSVAVWDRASGEGLYRVTGYTAYITSVQFDGERLVSDGTNNVVAAHRFVDVDGDGEL